MIFKKCYQGRWPWPKEGRQSEKLALLSANLGGATILLLLMGCVQIPLKSICYMDFKAKKCWVHRDMDIGYDFKNMEMMNEHCSQVSDKGELLYPNAPCWYAIDSTDFERIQQRLSR